MIKAFNVARVFPNKDFTEIYISELKISTWGKHIFSYTNFAIKGRSATFASLQTRSTKNGVVVQLVRMPACHAGGRGFESRPFRKSLRNF
jgi:hypothetical protein